jgi:molybdopterin molybdotransferase
MREHSVSWKTARVPLNEAHNRYLAEDLTADRDGPPFHRVAMDGIAISSDVENPHQHNFLCEGTQAAGEAQLIKSKKGSCLEAMTGAVLPENCDAIVPFEQCDKVDEQHYHIKPDFEIRPMLNIHQQGCDFKKGDLLLSKSKKLRAPEIAVAASLGRTQPLVYLEPNIAIITTGSELVDVQDTPLPHQIRKSNIHAASACLEQFGFKRISHYHIPDHFEDTLTQLSKCLEQYDVLILSGGVSKGKFDYVPDALNQLGVEKHFHRIAQKPGKPMWFGTKNKKCIYALPGNPVSLLVCLRRYVIPALLHSVTNLPSPTYLSLGETFRPKAKLTLFSAVSIHSSPSAGNSAHKVSHHGSGDYASLIHSQGFVELSPKNEDYQKGEFVPFYDWRVL